MNRIVFSREGGLRPAAVIVAVPALPALRPTPEIAPEPAPDGAGELLAQTAAK